MSHPVSHNPPTRILMGPGPSEASPRVLRALSRSLLGHLDPVFVKLMDELQTMLRSVFQTSNPLTLAISGTGSAGMETAVVNLIEPGDGMIVCVNGVFGGRMVDVAQRAGAKVIRMDQPWGQVFALEQLTEAVKTHRPKVLGIVHAETSTGALQPMAGLGQVCHDHGTLLLMDCVTSLGGTDVRIDDWGVDAAYSGTQKCLSCPPGLAPVTFSPQALEVIKGRKTKIQSWYLDVSMIASYWGTDRVYHHTAPISMNYALHEALVELLDEGLVNRIERHRRLAGVLQAGLEALGLKYLAAAGHRLPMLHAVSIPSGVDDMKVRKALLDEYGIEIGGGLGDFKGKAWRVGLMGQSCKSAYILTLLAALERLLGQQGHKIVPGAGVAAVNRQLDEK